jgi:hypothetical protein
MLNRLNEALSRRLLTGCASLAVACAAGQTHAQTPVTVVDHSFEQLAIPDPGVDADISEGVFPVFQSQFAPFNPSGWQETGVPSEFEQNGQIFLGLLDAGIFLNRSYNLGTTEEPFPSPTVPNADGNQLAYMRFSADANSTGPKTSVSQLTEAFEPFTRYNFTIALGQGQLQPPGTSVESTNGPYTAIISIGYYTDGATANSGFNALASETIYANEADAPTGEPFMLFGGVLDDFSVVLETDDAIFDTPLVIHVEQSGGSTGGINLDNARLTKTAVPEPTSLALLGLGGLLLARRRRS